MVVEVKQGLEVYSRISVLFLISVSVGFVFNF